MAIKPQSASGCLPEASFAIRKHPVMVSLKSVVNDIPRDGSAQEALVVF